MDEWTNVMTDQNGRMNEHHDWPEWTNERTTWLTRMNEWTNDLTDQNEWTNDGRMAEWQNGRTAERQET